MVRWATVYLGAGSQKSSAKPRDMKRTVDQSYSTGKTWHQLKFDHT